MMNKNFIKKIILILSPIVLLIVMFIGSIRYKTEYAKTLVEMNISPSEIYQLEIYEVGEPDWPFGKTDCRFILNKDYKEISSFDFSIRDDGCRASVNNFLVDWRTNKVVIQVSGEEQNTIQYEMYYTGSTFVLNMEENI